MHDAVAKAVAALEGDIWALQIVVQRLLGQRAVDAKIPPDVMMRAEHAQASAELAAGALEGASQECGDIMRARAQEMLDQIYSVASTTRPGKGKGPSSP
jgi:hypothetical protein